MSPTYVSTIHVVRLDYKWPGHDSIQRNTIQLVQNAVTGPEGPVFGIGNAGNPNTASNEEIQKMTFEQWNSSFEATTPVTERAEIADEEKETIFKEGKKRFNKLYSLLLNDVLVVMIPKHGVVGVGLVSRTAFVGSKLADSDPFSHQVGMTWLVEPRVESGQFVSLMKFQQVQRMLNNQPPLATINSHINQEAARRLLAALLLLA